MRNRIKQTSNNNKMPAKSSVSPFEWIYKHEDTPKPADKEGGVWAYTNQIKLYGRGGHPTRVSIQQWYFIKSGAELSF